MSRIYFHSPSDTTELHGSERAYLDGICRRFAASVYNVESGFRDIERAGRIMEIIPESGSRTTSDLHKWYRQAVAEEDRWKKANEGRAPGLASYVSLNHQPGELFTKQLSMYLDGTGFSESPFVIADVKLDAGNVSLNTAIAGGSDELALAAKIHGYCESHAFVEGEDRTWLAKIMQSGLDKGMYRQVVNNLGGTRQSWENVIELLQSRDDEPVVMSYSVCEEFPNEHIANWEAPELPAEWLPDWADNAQGLKEWNELSDDAKKETRDEHSSDQWYSLPDEQQWELAMDALREDHPYLRISPENLRGIMFHYPVSAYDIVHADRDERIKKAATRDEVA